MGLALGQMQKIEQGDSSISPLLPALDSGCDVTNCSKFLLPELPAVMDSNLELETKGK